MTGLSILVLFLVLPDATQTKVQKVKASEEARRRLSDESARLASLERLEDRLVQGRKRIEAFLGSVPNQSVGQLHGQVSQRVHDLAGKHGVRLQAIKYGLPTQQGTKGTDLEILHVEFTALGIYPSLKPFMLELEDTRQNHLPFAVAAAKIEESPEGARLTVTLRAFRRTGSVLPEAGEAGP